MKVSHPHSNLSASRRTHDLRHGAATIALAAHVDLKTVQDMLGHTSYAFTADAYATVLPEQAKRAAETTAQFVLDALQRLPRPAPGPKAQARATA